MFAKYASSYAPKPVALVTFQAAGKGPRPF